MMTKRFLRILLICLPIFAISAALPVSAGALGTLPSPNSEPRHVVCTELSRQAKEYYTDEYSYMSLSTMSAAEDVSTSYSATQNNELYSALHSLMAQTHTYYATYSGYNKGSLAYFWNSTDAVENSGTYIMFYSDVIGNAEGISLNREHIWPKSHASFATKKGGGGSDLHHLRPSASKVNSAKSDHIFGNVNGVYDEGVTEGIFNGEVCWYLNKNLDLFECKDDVKGDVARILLYVYCRWEQPNLYTDMKENLPEPDSDSKSNSGTKVIESLDTLLSWCESDPVDTWEMERNDLVQDIQGNRNVFIDYPELAFQMFGRDIPDDMTTPSSADKPIIRSLRGDADRDGDVTVTDATAIQRVLINVSGIETIDPDRADINGDGVDVTDATLIQRFILKIANPFNIGDEI